jgi:hypothetical protein
MADVVEYNGEKYERSGSTWINARTRVKPPLTVISTLEQRYGSIFTPSKSGASVKISGASPKPHPGRDFTGLKEHDFSSDVTGTTWRRATTLKGLLAHRLSTTTSRNFETYSGRGARVYIGQPPRFDKGNPDQFNLPRAKFRFSLDESAAYYSFYIERPNHEMDDQWEWPIFLDALRRSEMTDYLEKVMAEHNLSMVVERSTGGATPVHSRVEVSLGDPLTRTVAGVSLPIAWADLADELENAVATDWYDVFFGGRMAKADAIAAGAEIAVPVIEVYVALLPLYDACAKRL